MKGMRTLVIEDSQVNLELVTYLLRAWGHEVLTAETGALGLALAASELPDLVLCDIQLPDIDGLEVARRLRADPRCAGLRLVALSALAMAHDVEASLAAGFEAHFTKPIDPQPFMAALAEQLGRREPTPVPPPVTATAAPAASVEADGEVPDTLRAPWPQCRLLLVDDQPLNMTFKRGLLEAAGYVMHEAGSLAQAMALLEHVRPDLLLSDRCLPDGDGLTLLAQWRARPDLAQRPFVILSSTVIDPDSQAQALAQGVTLYLLRPIEPLVLLAHLRRLLNRP